MKIKIIDLLNKIANKEIKDNFKCKYNQIVYFWSQHGKDLRYHLADEIGYDLIDIISTYNLNDEVEIIEERPKEIEELEMTSGNILDKASLARYTARNREKINELIKEINLLKKENDKK